MFEIYHFSLIAIIQENNCVFIHILENEIRVVKTTIHILLLMEPGALLSVPHPGSSRQLPAHYADTGVSTIIYPYQSRVFCLWNNAEHSNNSGRILSHFL